MARWYGSTRNRISRRTLLRGTGIGVAGLAGASLLGCGTDDEPTTPGTTPTAAPGNGTPAPTPDPVEEGILAARTDTTDRAVPGGTLPGQELRDVESLDPLATESFTSNFITRYEYPQLLQFVPGLGDSPATGEADATDIALATSYEYAEDTRLILHLREDALWDDRAPTSSRPVDAQDVVFSWDKFKNQSISRSSLSNEVSDAAPIISMEAIDDHTVEVTTAFPYAPLLQGLAYSRWLQIMPREADGGFDPRAETRGAGPFRLTRYDRGSRFEWEKNPNFWQYPDRPFVDRIENPIIPEYAQRLAQFRAGRLFGGVMQQEDVVSTKEEIPELRALMGEFGRQVWQIYFGLRPDSPFRDERVRQAVSMSIDRELILDTFYDADRFRDAGWPVEQRMVGMGIGVGYEGFWLDPTGPDLGEDAKYLNFNPEEASQLLQAAGHHGWEGRLSYIPTPQYGTAFPRVGEAYTQILNSTGNFNVRDHHAEYQIEYLSNIYFSEGDFEGIAWGASTTFPHPAQHLLDYYHSQGARQKVAFEGDPDSIEGQRESDEIVNRAIRAIDFEEQVDAAHEFQRFNASRVPMVPSVFPGAQPGFQLYWPWVKNLGYHRGYLEDTEWVSVRNWWIDQELKRELGHA